VTGWATIRLVAHRELRERFRSRVFRGSTIVGALIVALIIVLPNLNSDKPESYDVGLVGVTDPVIAAAVANSGPAIGADVIRVHEISDVARARADIRTGVLDIALVNGRSIIIKNPLDSDRIDARYRLVAAVSEASRLQSALTDAGLTSEQAAKALSAPPLAVEALGRPKADTGDQLTNFIGVIAIFIFFQQYGSWILVGVAEEKSSRIAEVLLAAVRPRQLVAGKILGIGLVGLAQALVVAITAIIASRVVGADVLKGTEGLAALQAVGWFALGFSFYGWAYAAAGSLVARQSDAQAAGFPISIPIFVGYFATVSSLSSTEPSSLVRVLAFLPPTAPLCMPTLIAAGRVEAWQVALVVVTSIVASIFMARLAAAVYSSAILRTGKRIKWIEAIRAA